MLDRHRFFKLPITMNTPILLRQEIAEKAIKLQKSNSLYTVILDLELQISAYKKLLTQKKIPNFLLAEIENHTNEYDVPPTAIVPVLEVIISDLERRFEILCYMFLES